jgi:hypothetical protein
MWSMLLLILICASVMSGIMMLAACRLSAFADARIAGSRDELHHEGIARISL